ncbi:MAG: DUF87 domain-containing protein [Candidatus Verstraetearchaeota archaeon]|nr:DUF87 domain-containing protein [Candidatus Verstraetearchaeota archaeon]
MSSVAPIVGKIEGVTSTESFSVVIQREDVGKNDYVEVKHEGKVYLLMIKEVKRSADRSLGVCTVVGVPPKTPFAPGSEVCLASEEAVRRGLGLVTKESEGVYIGKLKAMEFKIWLPIKKLTRVFIVGKPGAGKSYTMGVIAEELIKKGIPLVIIDAHGEYSSLKVPADSPSKEFHVEPRSYAEQIIEFGDMVFNPGADIDVSALENTKPEDIVCQMQCTIVNLRGLGSNEQYSTVAKLLKRLLEAAMVMQVPPFYLALDEAHLFAGRSKRSDPYVKETLEVVRRFAQEGRKFGANLVVLTQRPQLLDMTVRSLSATWVIHQLTDPNDVRIAVESGGLSKEWEYDINWLEPGDAIITGDVVERIPLHVRIRSRETRHGAPGFNPLDFVSPEERAKMKKRMAALKEKLMRMRAAPGTPPELPPALPSLYMPIKVDEQDLLSTLKENKSLDSVEVLKSDLRYMPALFSEVSVMSVRKTPEIEFKDRMRRLVPADSSVSMIDWRHESAYNLVAKEALDFPPTPSPSREGRYEQPSSVILEASSVEALKGPLKTFTASKLTQTIYYHKALGEYSRPGESMDVFNSRLRARLEDMKRTKVSEVQSSYAAKMQEVRSSMNAAKEEYESIRKLVEGIRGELRSLERDRVRAGRERRSTLKISAQIQTREARLARLEKRVSELSEKISSYRRDEDRLEKAVRADILKAEREVEAVLDAPLQNIVFQPKVDEVDVEALQLVWIPVIEAIYRVSFEGMTADFKFEWNAVNGRGIFGTCSECGTTIESLEGGLFCCKCGQIYCSDHLQVCSACGRSACSEHVWTCPECGKVYCVDERPLICAACGKKMCAECAVRCANCADKVYCKNHVRECSVCRNLYCPEHYKEHIACCSKCGKELCVVEQVKCKVCGKTFGEECVVKCSRCGEEVCKDDTWYCTNCGKAFCAEEPKLKCKVCGRPICESCVVACSVCGAPLCKTHVKVCTSCGGRVCQDCLVETKRLGVFKKVVCKSCAER